VGANRPLEGCKPSFHADPGIQEVFGGSVAHRSYHRDGQVDTALEYGRGQQHIYQIMAGKSPEADTSIANELHGCAQG
jgi:hypothetical protein